MNAPIGIVVGDVHYVATPETLKRSPVLARGIATMRPRDFLGFVTLDRGPLNCVDIDRDGPLFGVILDELRGVPESVRTAGLQPCELEQLQEERRAYGLEPAELTLAAFNALHDVWVPVQYERGGFENDWTKRGRALPQPIVVAGSERFCATTPTLSRLTNVHALTQCISDGNIFDSRIDFVDCDPLYFTVLLRWARGTRPDVCILHLDAAEKTRLLYEAERFGAAALAEHLRVDLASEHVATLAV